MPSFRYAFIQICNQTFFLWRERVAVLRVMLEVQLQYLPLLGNIFHFHALLVHGHQALPFEAAFRQRQARRISVQVVSVQVGHVIFRFARVISFDQRVAGLCVAFAYHGDSASHPSLD